MHPYCLFCVTQKAKSIVDTLDMLAIGHAIAPKIIQRKWIKGKSYEEVHDYLPGYIFLYTDEPIRDFLSIRRIPGVLRILGSEEDLFELHDADRAFAEMLLEMDGTIGILKAYEEGSIVKLDRALFGDFEGKIVRFDRGRKRAEIEFDFDGKKQRVWCGVELISSIRKESDTTPSEGEG